MIKEKEGVEWIKEIYEETGREITEGDIIN